LSFVTTDGSAGKEPDQPAAPARRVLEGCRRGLSWPRPAPGRRRAPRGGRTVRGAQRTYKHFADRDELVATVCTRPWRTAPHRPPGVGRVRRQVRRSPPRPAPRYRDRPAYLEFAARTGPVLRDRLRPPHQPPTAASETADADRAAPPAPAQLRASERTGGAASLTASPRRDRVPHLVHGCTAGSSPRKAPFVTLPTSPHHSKKLTPFHRSSLR